MATPENRPHEILRFGSMTGTAAIDAGFIIGTIFGPLAAIPGFLAGGGAWYLYEHGYAQQAIKKFIEEHRPNNSTS